MRGSDIRKRAGFTLVELMIVVAIIGVLVAIAIPQFERFTAKTRRAEAIGILRGFDTAQQAHLAASDTFLAGTVQTVFTNLGFDITQPKFYFILPTDVIWGCADFEPLAATCPDTPAPCPSYGALFSGNIDHDDTLDQVVIHSDSTICPTYFTGTYPTGKPVVVWDDLIL